MCSHNINFKNLVYEFTFIDSTLIYYLKLHFIFANLSEYYFMYFFLLHSIQFNNKNSIHLHVFSLTQPRLSGIIDKPTAKIHHRIPAE